jgi:aminopeptidase N
VYFYSLDLKIIPKKKRIAGSNSIYFTVTQPSRVIQIDLFDNYKVHSILWNGAPLTWKREYNALFIAFPRELLTGEKQTITISYSGKPRTAPNPPWDGGFVWSHDDNKDLWVGVACEQLGASSWWPVKDHMTDKPDSLLISLQVPKGYKAVANGNLRSMASPDKKYDRFTWFVSYPINSYNVTFYIGKYESFSDTLVSGRDTVRLDYNVLHYNLELAKKHFRQTREIVGFYNRAFGLYPFRRDGFGLVESPYEGMEHQSAIAYGNGYDNTGPNAYRNKMYDFIIVHEAAHEWWGNSVSAGDMADIWIHEGFATYAEYMFLEDRFGKDEYLHQLSENSGYIFNIWPMVQNRDVNENAFAGEDVYNKEHLCCIVSDAPSITIPCSLALYEISVSATVMVRSNSGDFVRFIEPLYRFRLYGFLRCFSFTTPACLFYPMSYFHDGDDMVIRYRWTGVNAGFFMPFGIATDRNESYRLEATTQWKEFRIPGCIFFNFYNLWNGYAGCKDNSFTYFVTNCIITNKKAPPWRGSKSLPATKCYLLAISSETVSLFLPFALRLDNTLRPLAVDILFLNPCLLRLFLLDG